MSNRTCHAGDRITVSPERNGQPHRRLEILRFEKSMIDSGTDEIKMVSRANFIECSMQIIIKRPTLKIDSRWVPKNYNAAPP